MSTVEETLVALRGGELVVVPTDTVYGLACRPDHEEPVRALSALKRRSPGQPIALVAAGVDALVELIPELPAQGLRRRPVHAGRAEPGAATPVAHGCPARTRSACGSP